MVEEVKESIKESLKEKFSSPFYGAFIISWCLWNWKIWYVTFFVDSALLLQKNSILKIDYILNKYTWDSFWNFVFSISHLFIFPMLSAYVIMFWLPKATRFFLKQFYENEKENRKIKFSAEREFQELEKGVLVAESSKLDVKKDVAEKRVAIQKIKEKTQQELWDEDYLEFRKSKYFDQFSTIRDVVYRYSGKIGEYDDYDRWREHTSPDLKAYCDSNGIIEITGNIRDNEHITLTAKGKYFMKKYTEEKP